MKIVKSVKDYIENIEEIRVQNKLGYSLVFRGQGNSSWEVQSTLERSGISEISLKDYYTEIDFLKPEINSFGHRFERKMTRKGYDFDFSDYQSISFNRFPDLEYLSYLRHHGFPTPFVDVSQSEYVALFFACEDLNEKNNAKVFAFRGDFGNTWMSGDPELHRIGHYIETDQRHIAQQSEYLVAVKFESSDEETMWKFVSFASYLKNEKDFMERHEDIWGFGCQSLIEIEIDGISKRAIMAELARMNINHYTLYLSEDALVQKLKYDFLRNIDKG